MKPNDIHREYSNKNISCGITSESPFFRLPSWPPPDDWPVCIDENGHVVSRFKDGRWRLESGRYFCIDFVNASYPNSFETRKYIRIKQVLDQENSNLFRLCISWFKWGDRRQINARGLQGYAYRIRPLFVLCAMEGISAADINRYPRVMEKLVEHMTPSTASETLLLFRELWSVRETVGFSLLSDRNLEQLAAMLPDHETQQTPYIPPQIWTYQVGRLRAFLDDFIAHKEQLSELSRHIFDAYMRNFGSPKQLFSKRKGKYGTKRSPFNKSCQMYKECTYIGSFFEVAESFGVAELLLKWRGESKARSVITFVGYLSMATFVANKYILNFSGMRLEESKSLRADCLVIEHDPMFGDVYMLCGETTKTISDDDARWITSPTVGIAVEVMATVARLNNEVRAQDPFDGLSPEEVDNPYLVQSPAFPWCGNFTRRGKGKKNHLNKKLNYGDWVSQHPMLFDPKELIIAKEDIRIARLVTPSLDPSVYAEGNVWRLSDHQLRRTTAVNMLASDLVRDTSVQYQLKHLRRAQALYYGQGFSHLRLNQKYAGEYLRTAYEMLRRRIAELANDRYISLHGANHKANLLSRIDPLVFEEPLNERDVVGIRNLVERGDLTWKQTLMGLCGNPEPCAYGGITNIFHCGVCGNGLIDRERLPMFLNFRRVLRERLTNVEPQGPDFDSIQLQLQTLEGLINVLQ